MSGGLYLLKARISFEIAIRNIVGHALVVVDGLLKQDRDLSAQVFQKIFT